MNNNAHTRRSLFMLVAFVLFLLLALSTGGVIAISAPWLLGGGLAAMAAAFLTGE